MTAFLGAALTAGGILLTALAALYLRHPRAPRWTRHEGVGELVAVALTATIGLGLGYLVVTALQFASEGASLVDLGVIAGCLVVFFLLWRLIAPRRRLRAYAAVEGETANVVEFEPAPEPPAPPAPRPVSRRAA